MKVKPVLDALEARGVRTTLVHTGQHYDPEMSDVFFRDLGLREPDCHLGVGSGTQAVQTAHVMVAFEPVVGRLDPDVVVVVGDVNSTMACALVAAKAGPLVAHVEAGLRSGDWSMPEEINRAVTDRVSDLLFASSPDAVTNLVAEGYRRDQIHLVGNVMVDTLMSNLERAQQRPALARFGVRPDEYGLVTIHRPANVEDEAVLRQLLAALRSIAEEIPLILPAHPRAAGRIGSVPGVTVTEPLGYLDFIALEANARLVLTDSGGIQEETTVLGVPCLTLRDNTERPITVSEGTNVVVGREPERIVGEAQRVLRDGIVPQRPALWDGRAAERIADVLVDVMSRDEWPRPTVVSDANPAYPTISGQ